MKTLQILLAVVMLPFGTLTLFPSCSALPAVAVSASAWLSDPKNQQLIQDIASSAISIIGLFGAAPSGRRDAFVVGELSKKYPDVPAGALQQIANHPYSYKKPHG